MSNLDVVTGAFSYTGRYIAEALLDRGRSVRTLTREPDPAHPLADRVEAVPFVFDDSLVGSLRGADTLYNTYWIRFERGPATFARAVENTATLFRAARQAGVRRVVHVSVANADPHSPFPYFRGKAETEQALRDSGLSHAIVRPTLVFGPDDILVNNIAWAVRNVPLFLVPRGARAEVQPVSVWDTARICVDLGARDDDAALDAAGRDSWGFQDFVRLIRRAVGGQARIVRAPAALGVGVARAAGLFLHDVVLTRDEVAALKAGLLVSHERALGEHGFETWVLEMGATLGRHYTSELRRNFRE